MTRLPRTSIGQYEDLELIGSGGMGEVYHARDPRLKRDVALKLLLPDFAQNEERVSRFRCEAEMFATLSHPNIATVYGLEEIDGELVLVLELVPASHPRSAASRKFLVNLPQVRPGPV